MNSSIKLNIQIILTCLSIAILYGCSTQKDNAANRGLQNLSARYNYIYNSNVLLNNYQENLAQTYKDNYDHILSVYIAPPSIDYLSGTTASNNVKELDEITLKAQAIVSEKNFSNYIDEAYILLGKTNFYKGNYYTAAAYFDYVERTYKANKKVHLNALNWKARTYMQLHNDDVATRLLDSIKILLDSVKHEKAEPLATLAQMSIYKHDYKMAVDYLTLAIKETNNMQSRTRWPYILAQLNEYNKDYEASLNHYKKVEHSNAAFEMYFNAKLSEIRVNDLLNHQTSSRKQQLLKLLKDDKNFDYTDQIYYEVAQDYFANGDYKKAEVYYKHSAQKSTSNENQKGLSFLKIADLNFEHLNDYVNAKLYYDSAINTLPKNYPSYEQILKKAQNLEYLSERYQIIANQDTLQVLARLTAQEREKKITQMFELKAQPIINNPPTAVRNEPSAVALNINMPNRGAFYFSNLTAVSRGFTDFKKRWGNRVLEDNWRQSIKSSAQLNQQNQANAIGNSQIANNNQGAAVANNKAIPDQIAAYTALLPLTEAQMAKSDQQIIDAYFEIAGFYLQVLADQKEAIKVYEALLARYPQNNRLEEIYYSLYLAYNGIDSLKTNYYKNLVLTKYPSSLYAKTILDPTFSTKQSALDVEVDKIYNHVFSNYEKKEYAAVINEVKETNQRFPGNSLQIQYDYLKAIAIGKTENLDSLLAAFDQIVKKYPTDSLIIPLINDHLTYINTNLSTFKLRKIALIDFDATAPNFTTPKPTVAPVQPLQTQSEKPTVVLPEPKLPVNSSIEDNFFSKAESSIYYFIVDIASLEVSLSSSRFGIGQFNRGNYTGNNLKHQLADLDEDQLIYVGNFESLDDVKAYTESISVQLPKIMKVQASIYKSFYISKENFDKIKDRTTLNRYLEFFKNNYSYK